MAKHGPDNHLWVTDMDNGKVVLFSPDSDERQHEIITGASAHAIAFSDDGRTAYITNQTRTVRRCRCRYRRLKTTVVRRQQGEQFVVHCAAHEP